MNSQQKRGMGLPVVEMGKGMPVVERGEERCNLMNLLHPVILNLPMITQVNKREPAQVITKLQNLNLPSNRLVTSRDSPDFPSPRSCQALPSGRVKEASSCNFAFPDLDMCSSLRAGSCEMDFFMILS